jgi:nucleotide-binding universal stress UspA family protein
VGALRKILLATDGSPNAQAAAAWVGCLVRDDPEAAVTVLTVFPLYVGYDANGATALAVPSDAEVAGLTAPVLADAVRALGDVAGRVDTLAEVGTPAEKIVEVADERGCDLIVLGRRGHGPLATLLVGSVSDRVVHLARRPVAVVNGG